MQIPSLVAVGALALLSASAAWAQDGAQTQGAVQSAPYPHDVVTLLTHSSPGSGSDLFLRELARRLGPQMGVDFVVELRDRALELADLFWTENPPETRNAQRFEAAIHALFLGQYPQALQFERFIYLYTAIDACNRLTAALRNFKNRHSHSQRIERMCQELGVEIPA